jgi:hypothetical protein
MREKATERSEIMKTLRLVLPLIGLFFSTTVCSILGGVVGDPCGEEPPERYIACQTQIAQNEATNDSIAALTQTESVLQITYPASAAQLTETVVAELQATDAALTAAAVLTLTAAPPSQITEPTAVLQSGTYEVDVSSGGRQHHSTWTLDVLNGVITGNSGWDCCPGPRVDPLSGAIAGNEVNIVRDCSGQGFEGPCTQTYHGRVEGNVIRGTITGTGIPPSGATWTLYLSP